MKSFEEFLNEKRVSNTVITKKLIDTPELYIALGDNNMPKVAELLSNGANPDIMTPVQGYTLLIYTIRKQLEDAFKLLLEHGADVNKSDTSHNTPLHTCVAYQDRDYFLELLLKEGANPNIANSDHQTPIELIFDMAKNIWVDDFAKYFELLLKHGAKVDYYILEEFKKPKPSNKNYEKLKEVYKKYHPNGL